MADDLVAYQHEVSVRLSGERADLPWAETYDLNLNSGSRLTTVKQLIPDIDGAVQSILYSLFYRMSRSVMVDHERQRYSGRPSSKRRRKQVRPERLRRLSRHGSRHPAARSRLELRQVSLGPKFVLSRWASI